MNIVSYSGGKDSTAMLLKMVEHGYKIDEVVFCDTGLEFPGMYDHIKKVEKRIGIKIKTLYPDHSFEWYLSRYQKKSGKFKDIPGLGWPGHMFRWCTGNLKTKIFDRYVKKFNNRITLFLGIAADEFFRTERDHYKNRKINVEFPLIELGIDEKTALEYCYQNGFNWDGLYDQFKRVSCFCCPLQQIGELRKLFNFYPDLWKEIERLDRLSYRDFRSDYTVSALRKKFEFENRQRLFTYEKHLFEEREK